jgi:uncharacterized delta-60 repeat protein
MRSWIIILAFVACAATSQTTAAPRNSGPRLDDTFGRGGAVVLRAPSQTHTRRTFVPRSWVIGDAVADRSGRVYVTWNGQGAATNVLAAYDAEGQLDRAFGGDGVLALGVLGSFGKVALDSAGRIILLGGAASPPDPAPLSDGREAVIVAVLPDGRLDPEFGFGGVQRQGSPTKFPRDVLSDGSGGVLVLESKSSSPRQYVVFRLGPDGVLDRTYGDDGFAVVPRIGDFVLTAHTVDATGRFVAVDSIDEEGDGLPRRYALVGLDASGRPDSTLGEQGTRVLDFGARRAPAVADLEVDAAGRYVVLGDDAPDGVHSSRSVPFIARFLSDGTPDSTWSGTEDGVRDFLADGALWGTDLWSLTIDGEIYYADGARYGPSGRNWGDTVVVRVDDDTEQVWTSPTRRFQGGGGFDEVLSARDGSVLAWTCLYGQRRSRRVVEGLVRLRFD